MHYENFEVKVSWSRQICFLACFAFGGGFAVGVVLPAILSTSESQVLDNSTAGTIEDIFKNHSYGQDFNYSKVSFLKPVRTEFKGIVQDGVYWGEDVEAALPLGYGREEHDSWKRSMRRAVAVKLEPGCGRMQNRLVTFRDGSMGCVRYRQNTDQIQGELFSFYLSQLLKLRNLAPSAVSVVDLDSELWQNLRNDIAAAQWNSNRVVVVTRFIPFLEAAAIPKIFKPVERHLNKLDIFEMKDSLVDLIELAQWSDLIIFDYLTANLDRIVNNLYNFQWNANIMDAPAHNLAKNEKELLVFLDNESGLLHGYRLLKKYEIYHSLLLDNLCLFRKQTAEAIKKLQKDGNIGQLLSEMFESDNDSDIRDILPALPDKTVKILNERIHRVHEQITKCEAKFS